MHEEHKNAIQCLAGKNSVEANAFCSGQRQQERQATPFCTSDEDPRLMGVLSWAELIFVSRIDPWPLLDKPPAASTMKAIGAASYSRRSFAGADFDAGLQKTPPPCMKIHVQVVFRLPESQCQDAKRIHLWRLPIKWLSEPHKLKAPMPLRSSCKLRETCLCHNMVDVWDHAPGISEGVLGRHPLLYKLSIGRVLSCCS